MARYSSWDDYKSRQKKNKNNYTSWTDYKVKNNVPLKRIESQEYFKPQYDQMKSAINNYKVDDRNKREKAKYENFAKTPAIEEFVRKNPEYNFDPQLEAFTKGPETRSIRQITEEYDYKPNRKPLTSQFDLGKTEIKPAYKTAPAQRLKEKAGEFAREITGKSRIPEHKQKMNEKMDILYVPGNYDLNKQTDFTKANWHLGKLQDLSGKEWAKKAKGRENIADEVDAKLAKFYDKYPEIIENDKNWLQQGIGGAAQMLPTQLNALKAGVSEGVPAALAGAGGALLAGQAGPQALAPEEIITVPGAAAAAYKAGSAKGSGAYMYQVEKGNSYQELTEAGVDPKKADLISDGVGMLNAGVELAQIDTWIKGLGKGISIIDNPVVKGQLNNKALRLLTEYAKNVGKESFQEVIQEAITIGGTAYGTGENPLTEMNKDRLADTFIQSAKSFSIMMLTGPLAGGSKLTYNQFKTRSQEMDQQIDTVIDKMEKNGFDPQVIGEMRNLVNDIRTKAPNPQIEQWADDAYTRLTEAKNKPIIEEETKKINKAIDSEPAAGSFDVDKPKDDFNLDDYVDQDSIDNMKKGLKRGYESQNNEDYRKLLDAGDLEYVNSRIKDQKEWLEAHAKDIKNKRHKDQIGKYQDLIAVRDLLRERKMDLAKGNTDAIRTLEAKYSDVDKPSVQTLATNYIEEGNRAIPNIVENLENRDYTVEERKAFVQALADEYGSEVEDIIDNFNFEHNFDLLNMDIDKKSETAKVLKDGDYYETAYPTNEYKQKIIDQFNKKQPETKGSIGESNKMPHTYLNERTAGFDKPVKIDPKYILENTKGGLTGEHIRAMDPDDNYGLAIEKLSKSIDDKGYDRKKPIIVNINRDGDAWIVEGNKRVRAAIANGINEIPAYIRYFDYGEEIVSGAFDPITIAEHNNSKTLLKGPSNMSGKRQYAFNQDKYDEMIKGRDSKQEPSKTTKSDPTDDVIDKALGSEAVHMGDDDVIPMRYTDSQINHFEKLMNRNDVEILDVRKKRTILYILANMELNGKTKKRLITIYETGSPRIDIVLGAIKDTDPVDYIDGVDVQQLRNSATERIESIRLPLAERNLNKFYDRNLQDKVVEEFARIMERKTLEDGTAALTYKDGLRSGGEPTNWLIKSIPGADRPIQMTQLPRGNAEYGVDGNVIENAADQADVQSPKEKFMDQAYVKGFDPMMVEAIYDTETSYLEDMLDDGFITKPEIKTFIDQMKGKMDQRKLDIVKNKLDIVDNDMIYRDLHVDYQRAYDAHRNVSFDPKNAAKMTQRDFATNMKEIESEVMAIAETDDMKAKANELLDDFAKRALDQLNDMLDSKSNVVSMAIAGPANFNKKQANKRGSAYDKKRENYLNFLEKGKERLKKQVKGEMSDDLRTQKQIDKYIKEADTVLAKMKAYANGDKTFSKSAFRNSLKGKLETLASNGEYEVVQAVLDHVKENQATPVVFSSRNGVWDLAKEAETNAKKIEQLEGKAPEQIAEYDDGTTIENDYADERVRIYFPDKPSPSIIKELKSHAWRWSPSNEAWQRKNTGAAVESAKRIIGQFKEIAENTQEESAVDQFTFKDVDLGDKEVVNLEAYPMLDYKAEDMVNETEIGFKDQGGYTDGYFYLLEEYTPQAIIDKLQEKEMFDERDNSQLYDKIKNVTLYDKNELTLEGLFKTEDRMVAVLKNADSDNYYHVDHKYYDYFVEKEGYHLFAKGDNKFENIFIAEVDYNADFIEPKSVGYLMQVRGKKINYGAIKDSLGSRPSAKLMRDLMFKKRQGIEGITTEYLDRIKEQATTTDDKGITRIDYKAVNNAYEFLLSKAERIRYMKDQFVTFDPDNGESVHYELGKTYVLEAPINNDINGDLQLKEVNSGDYMVARNEDFDKLIIDKHYIAETRTKKAMDQIKEMGYENVNIPLREDLTKDEYDRFTEKIVRGLEDYERYKDNYVMFDGEKWEITNLNESRPSFDMKSINSDRVVNDAPLEWLTERIDRPDKSERYKEQGLNFQAKPEAGSILVSFYDGSSLLKDNGGKRIKLQVKKSDLLHAETVTQAIKNAMNEQFVNERRRPSVEITGQHMMAMEKAIKEVYEFDYEKKVDDLFRKTLNSDNDTKNYSIQDFTANKYQPGPLRNKTLKSPQQMNNELKRDFKIGITSKRFRKTKAAAHYKPGVKMIEAKIDNTLGPTMHELGHHFDTKYNLQEKFMPIIKDMIDKMPKAFKDNYKQNELAGEAIAEFVRLYMTKPQSAIDFSPEFMSAFLKAITKKDKNLLAKHREQISFWLNSTTREQMFSTISSSLDRTNWTQLKDDFSGNMAKLRKKGYMYLWDTNKPIDDLVGMIEKMTGKKIPNVNNMYLLAEHARDSSMIAKSIRNNFLVNPQLEKIGPSLNSIISKVTKEEFADFDNYLKAKRSLDLAKREHRIYSDDFSIEDIEMQVAAYENEKPHFKKISEELYSWWQAFTQAWVVDTGLLDQEVYDHMKEIDPHYVPLFRVTDEVTILNNDIRNLPTRGYANKSNPMKRMSKKGNAQDTFSPIESLIIETDRYVTTVKRREVMLAIHRLYQKMNKKGTARDEAGIAQDGIGYIINEVGPGFSMDQVDVSRKKQDAIYRLLIDFAKKNDVPMVTRLLENGNVTSAIKAAEKFGFEGASILDQTIDDVVKSFKPMAIDKETNIITVKDEDGKVHHYEVYDELLLNALLNISANQVEGMTRIISQARRVMQTIYTTLDPTFIARNVIRDFPQAIAASEGMPHKFAQAYFEALIDRIQHGEISQNYEAAGGGYASPTGASRNALQESMAEMIPGWKKEHKFLNLLQNVEKFADATEQAPRMAEYKQHIEKYGNDYGSKLEAIYKAKDVTVNFGRRGEVMNTMLGNSIPFLNAALGGFDKIRRMHNKENIMKTVPRAIVAVTVAQMLQMAYWYGDEEREKEYNDIGSYLKDSYWILPNPFNPDGPKIRLAKPREIGMIYGSAFNRAFDLIIKNDPEAFDNFPSNFTRVLMPPTDTIFSAISDVKQNKTWYGGTVVPYAYQTLQVDFREDRNTSAIAKNLAKVLPDFEWASPMALDYLIKQYGGIYGKFAISSTDQIKGNFFEPVERSFTADEAYSNDYVSNFYDHLAHLDAVKNTAKRKGDFKGFYSNEVHDAYKTVADRMSSLYDIRDQLEIIRTYPENEQRKVYLEYLESNESFDYDSFKDMSIKRTTRQVQYEIMKAAKAAEEIYKEYEKNYKQRD